MSLSRRRMLQGLAGAGAAAAIPYVSANRAAAATGTFGVASANILSDLGRQKFRSDLNAVLGKAGLIGLQEMQGRRGYMKNDWGGRSDWHVYAPFPSDKPRPAWAAEAMLLARKDRFDVLDRGTLFVCDTNGTDAPPPPRYITWVSYRDKRTKIKITHINSHANAGIEDNGRPVNIPRTADAMKHFRMLRDLAARKAGQSGQVVLTGDLNVDFAADRRVRAAGFPYRVLDEGGDPDRKPGLRSCFEKFGLPNRGTHGSRCIDYVYEWTRLPNWRKIKMTGFYVADKGHSDHRPIVARFRVLD